MSGRLSAGKLWFWGILALALALRIAAFSLFDTIHPDEVLQYQERAFRMAFGHGIVPWESVHGVRNALIPDLLAAPMGLAAWLGVDYPLPLLAARAMFAAACLVVVPAAYWIGSLRSPRHGLVAMFAAAVWFESVLFGVQVLSESIATAMACAGAAAILRARENRGMALLAGFLLALSVLLRLQYAAFAGVLALAALTTDRRAWLRLVLGALPALVLGAVTDLAAGQMPFAWIAANVTMNLGQGVAASHGVSPPMAYVQGIFMRLHPFALPILAGAVLSGPRHRPLLLAALANLLVHSLIGHKEYRFVWLSVLVLVVLAAIASVDLADRLLARRPSRRPRALLAPGLPCLVWAGASLAAFLATGGAGALRSGAAITRQAIAAAALPETCAVAVPDADRKTLAHAFLPRPVDLYLVPDPMNEGKAPLSPAILDAADALVLTGPVRPPEPYRQIGCADEAGKRACLFLREGDCHNRDAAAQHDFQNVLLEGHRRQVR